MKQREIMVLMEAVGPELLEVEVRVRAEFQAHVVQLRAEFSAQLAAEKLAHGAEVAALWAEIERLKALPLAKDGEPGRSVTLDDVAPLIREEVSRSVAALPPAKDGEPGRSVTLDEVAPLIREEVSRSVAALPPAKDGEPGLLPMVEDWIDRVYKAGEAVRFEGSTYQARRLTEKPPPHEAWFCIARAGANGKDGASVNPRGNWSPDETYSRLDKVNLDNAQFTALRDDPGPCPGAGWMQDSWRGKPGRPGDRGEPGPPGPPGRAAPRMIALEADDTALLAASFDDGSKVEGDLAPLFSRRVR